ncbi:esterase family protein [Fimbriiglobus ruber]|uniref:Esterase n=1 Tax=Fimbriiglobus ruber TaxID=1908690 RepID=A0A225DLJ2_9BACT|nr:alpha/beta fold hydrolase [Fimbriiglobus ruber]OWK40494.1 esterase [Fimbriiglobus ruber]
MHREYHRWYSPWLHRDMELLVLGHAGARVLVFPTRAGRFFDYENWGLAETLRPKLAGGEYQLFCVDSVDAESFYAEHAAPADRIRRHARYEEYLLHEVVPFTLSRNPDPRFVTHGCSMGAYHAVNFAFRHPHQVSKVIALSGRYDLTTPVGDFRDLLDGYYDETVYYHTPSHFVPNLCDEHILGHLRLMEVVLAVGEADPFAENNRCLSGALWGRGVWHALRLWPGRSHKPAAWTRMVREYF